MLGEGERVEVLTERHEHAAVVRILLGDTKAEHVAVERIRSTRDGSS